MSKTKYLALNGIAAGLYAALSLAVPVLSYGTVIQLRFSEALIPVTAVMPEICPGVVFGCFIANLLSAIFGLNPLGFVDCTVGTFATAAAVFFTVKIGKRIRSKKLRFLLLPLPNIVINSVIIGAETVFISGGGTMGFFLFMLGVAAGETAVCFTLGNLLVSVFEKTFKTR